MEHELRKVGTRPASAKPPLRSLEPEPDHDCSLCPRLAAFRASNRSQKPQWFNAPVPSFGDQNGRLLIIDLAPGLQGANRTGRPFTGDYAGDLLYPTLLEYGFAEGRYQARPDDGLTLKDCRIGNAVHCVPPQNKPLPIEINTCRQFLVATMDSMPRLQAIVALGNIVKRQTLIMGFSDTFALIGVVLAVAAVALLGDAKIGL